jgi:hypothetical protein
MKTLEEAVEQLKHDRSRPVRAEVGDMVIEVRAVNPTIAEGSAADVFAEIGPWLGETTEEMLQLLTAARRRGGQRSVPDL